MPSNPTAAPLVNLCALAGALLLSLPATARAADAPPSLPRFMRLEYLRPPGNTCPDATEVENEVIFNAKRNPWKADAGPVLRVSIQRRAGGYAASLEVRDEAGGLIWPREVHSTTCLGLVQNLGFVVGEMLRDPLPDPSHLPRFVRLEYVRPPGYGCPDPEDMENELILNAHRNPVRSDAPAVLRVVIERRNGMFQATFEIRDEAGQLLWAREVDPRPSCWTEADRAGFQAGDLFRDPFPAPAKASAPPPAPPSAPPPAPPSAPVPLPARDVLPSPPPSRSEPLRFNLGVTGALSLRTAGPVAAFNLIADAGLRWPSFSIAAQFRWVPPVVAVVDAAGSPLVHVQQFSGGIVPCGHLSVAFLCGVGEVIETRGTGSPDVMPAAMTALSIAAGGRIGADLPLPWWRHMFALRVSADVLGTLHDVAFHEVTRSAPSWTTPGLAASFGAGIVTDFRLR